MNAAGASYFQTLFHDDGSHAIVRSHDAVPHEVGRQRTGGAPGGRVFGLLDLWGVSLVRELAYTLIASNRSVFSKLTRLLRLSRPV